MSEVRITQEEFDRASAEVARLQSDLSITNADHIALWLEANLPDASISYLACRIIEAHEAEAARRNADVELCEALDRAICFSAYRRSDPLAIRFEFANEDDRLAAANAVDAAMLAEREKGGAA